MRFVLRKKENDQRRPMEPMMPWSGDNHMQRPMRPVMPGHMHAPMPAPMPYPWMQRPMEPIDLWTMPQWNMQMWEPELEDDPTEARDMEYWQQLYPEQTRRVQREVSHQCDLLDYEGSVMYDEYPDRIALARICESIYNTLMQNGIISEPPRPDQEFINGNQRDMEDASYMDDDKYSSNSSDRPMDGQNYDPIGSVDMMQYRQTIRRPSRSLQNLIEVLLYQEMHHRWRRRRRNRRWW